MDINAERISELEQRLAAAETALQAAREGMREECMKLCDEWARMNPELVSVFREFEYRIRAIKP